MGLRLSLGEDWRARDVVEELSLGAHTVGDVTKGNAGNEETLRDRHRALGN